jgi:hypothetical protein
MCDDIKRFYEKWEQKPKYAEILMKSTKRILYLHKLFLINGVVVYIAPYIIQLLVYLIQGKCILFIYIYLPFTNPDDEGIGFMTNALAFLFCLPFIYNLGTLVSNIYFPLSMHTVAMVNVICETVDDAIEKIEKTKNVRWQNPKKFRINKFKTKADLADKLLYELIQSQIEYENFKRIFLDFASVTTFCEISSNFISFGFSIAYVYFISIPLGLTLLLMLVIQLATFCGAGSMIEATNEKLLTKVLDFPWLELSLEKKKIFLQLVHVCQNTANLEVPLYGSINKETFTDTITAGYEFFNYLINFVR